MGMWGEVSKLYEELLIDKISSLGFCYKGKHLVGWNSEQSILINGKEVITIGGEYEERKATRKPVFKKPDLFHRFSRKPLGDINVLLNADAFKIQEEELFNYVVEEAIALISSRLFAKNRSKVFFISALRGEVKPAESAEKWGGMGRNSR